MQLEHEVTPSVLEYEPAPQFAQALAPEREYEPASQNEHVVETIALNAAENFPAAQL